MRTPLQDIDFLARSAHRVNALGALTAGPQSRADLRTAVGASNATIGRLLHEFETRAWVTRTGPSYELTPLGGFVADGFFELVERVETEHSFRDVWQWFPSDLGFTIDMFAGATITLPDARNPYAPNRRYVELLAASRSLREMGSTPLKPANARVVLDRAADGMQVELVFPRDALASMVEVAPDVATAALERGTLVLLANEAVPGGVALFDDCVGTCCRDGATGLSRAIVDTPSKAAILHAERLYEASRADARPVDVEGARL